MRTFVAVFPPLEVRKETLASAKRLLLGNQQVRWTRPENFHLTLKFLGDVREEVLDSLCEALGEVCAGHDPFEIGLAGLGAFPSARRARILWYGAGVGSDRLRSLATDLDAALVPLGFEPEQRPYTPHLTLGRVRGRPASLNLPPGKQDIGFRVERVNLMESTLTEGGAVYKPLKTFALEEKSSPSSSRERRGGRRS